MVGRVKNKDGIAENVDDKENSRRGYGDIINQTPFSNMPMVMVDLHIDIKRPEKRHEDSQVMTDGIDNANERSS